MRAEAVQRARSISLHLAHLGNKFVQLLIKVIVDGS